ncbi:MAG: pantoate--beta-alanine ligase [Chitinophagales bacterium]|nr:pantoate--beta-alanine ligase [Chitinophagales bacterium]
MVLQKHIQLIDKQLKRLKSEGLSVGFVPTMGALHQGHISLIKASKKACDITVCSIFVNPTQFNDKTDFEKYPITIDRDVELLHDAGCDILFLPSVKEIYPKGLANSNKIDFGFLAQTLEGEHRPGHFDGMAQVVERLLRVVKPDKLFMGQKDFQQQLIVAELIRKRKLKTKLVTCATVREKDGLAMSSRNVRLHDEARKQSLIISKTLKAVKRKVSSSKAAIAAIQKWGYSQLAASPGVEVEYFEIRDATNLKPEVDKKKKLVALTAAKVGGVRLIDNMLL